MALDKDIKIFLDRYHNKQHQPYSSYTPIELRQWFNDGFSNKKPPAQIHVARIIEKDIINPAGTLTLRIYYPAGDAPFPALMYFHGGGFVIRDNMDTYDRTCRMICHGAQCVVIAVNFRLAPEHPFPAAPKDCYAATAWVAENAGELGIDNQHFGVWGESCGGNLAAVVAMMARDKAGPSLVCQIIVCPMLDYNFETESYNQNGGGEFLLSKDSMQWFWHHYLSCKLDAKNPYCAPCQAVDLAKLPPALIMTVEYDPLRDEGKSFADQLASASVAIDYREYEGLIHGVFDLCDVSNVANNACVDVINEVKKILHHHTEQYAEQEP